MSDIYALRQQLIAAALDLAATQCSPYDETNDPNYDASLEYREDHLNEAARAYVQELVDRDNDYRYGPDDQR